MTESPLLLALTIGVGVCFLFDWLSVGLHFKWINYFSKPLAMVMVMLWTLTAARGEVGLFIVILLIAQSDCLAGDIFLLFPDRFFMFGLASFLNGHLLYNGLMMYLIITRMMEPQAWTDHSWKLFLAAGIFVMLLFIAYQVIRPSTYFREKDRRLGIAVQVYMVILTFETAVSFLTVGIQPRISLLNILLPIGVLLFLLSDALIAFDRFITKSFQAKLFIRISYHLAQFCIACGFLYIAGYLGS